MKRCPKCKRTKRNSSFGISGSRLKSWCKDCDNADRRRHYRENRKRLIAQSRAWQKRNRNLYLKIKRESVLKTFGLTIRDWNNLYKQQGKGCAICGVKKNSDRRLAVDHDHRTGNVRGLLCTPCNQGLGKFKDNIELLQNAIQYLMKGTRNGTKVQ